MRKDKHFSYFGSQTITALFLQTFYAVPMNISVVGTYVSREKLAILNVTVLTGVAMVADVIIRQLLLLGLYVQQ